MSMTQEEIEALMACYLNETNFPRFYYVDSPKGYGILELSWKQAQRVTSPSKHLNTVEINEGRFKRDFEKKLKTRLIMDNETKLGLCRMILNRHRQNMTHTEKERVFIEKYFEKNPEYLI